MDEGADPNHSSYKRVGNGRTPLHTTCYWNNPEGVKLLIQRGANVEAIDRATGNTPLHEACSHGFVECVKPFLTLDQDFDPGDLSVTSSASVAVYSVCN